MAGNTWLAHGTQVVWEADPRTMTVLVHRVGEPAQRLSQSDTLDGGSVLPRFALPLSVNLGRWRGGRLLRRWVRFHCL